MNYVVPLTAPASPAQLPAHAKRPAHSPAGLVGDTPVLWIGEPFTAAGRGFWAKLESHNPGGIKDRSALHMVLGGVFKCHAHIRSDARVTAAW